MKTLSFAVVALLSFGHASAFAEVLTYVDGRDLPLEGRVFADTPTYYERLPSSVSTNVNLMARRAARQAAGLQFRFRTNSDVLDFRWVLRHDKAVSDRVDDNMTGILAAGLDVYRQSADGSWHYVTSARPGYGCGGQGTDRPTTTTNAFRMAWKPDEACAVYLPCYGAIADFRLGIRPGSSVEKIAHASLAKPVVAYGTSITQGGCASRPGLAWVSVVGRALDVPVANLGFSGAGRMELEMAGHLASIDASCYILDCIGNMTVPMIDERFEPFVRKLCALKPTVPVVVMERVVSDRVNDGKNAALKRAFARLEADGVRHLLYVPSSRLLPAGGEETVDGVHPNDLGMSQIATVMTSVVRHALSTPHDQPERLFAPGSFIPEGMYFPDVMVCRDEPVNLPELLRTSDGKAVTTKDEWERVRRPEILKFFTEEMFGIRPVERPADLTFERLSPDKLVLDGKALRKRIMAKFSGPYGSYRFSFSCFIPTGVRKPAVFINMACPSRNDFLDPDLTIPNGYWPVREILARGYATIGYQPEELAWDEYHPHFINGQFEARDPDFTNDVYTCFMKKRTERSWGSFSVWAWGASRIADWIETEPLLDAGRIAIVGHSRCGKTALWCGATDARFAMVCANDSGCCGAKLNHVVLPYAEPIGICNYCNPHWFCKAFRKYNGQDAVTPYDQHWLIALTAPRLVCIASASDDRGAGPWGEFLGARHASPAWELYGKKGLVETGPYAIERPFLDGSVGYHMRQGPHNLADYDWKQYLDFADRHLTRR